MLLHSPIYPSYVHSSSHSAFHSPALVARYQHQQQHPLHSSLVAAAHFQQLQSSLSLTPFGTPLHSPLVRAVQTIGDNCSSNIPALNLNHQQQSSSYLAHPHAEEEQIQQHEADSSENNINKCKIEHPSEMHLLEALHTKQEATAHTSPLLCNTSRPFFHRSQSEPQVAGNGVAYYSPPTIIRPSGSLSRFCLPPPVVVEAPKQQHQPHQPKYLTKMLRMKKEMKQEDQEDEDNAVKEAMPKVGDFSYNPFLKRSRSLTSSLSPATPVPVGSQWLHLSQQPRLHSHCMHVFNQIDDVKEAIVEKVKELKTNGNANDINQEASTSTSLLSSDSDHSALTDYIYQRFACTRIEVTQLYLQRAKFQSVLEEEAKRKGLVLPKDVEVEASTLALSYPIVPQTPVDAPLPQAATLIDASSIDEEVACSSVAAHVLQLSPASGFSSMPKLEARESVCTTIGTTERMVSPPSLVSGVTVLLPVAVTMDMDVDDEAAVLASPCTPVRELISEIRVPPAHSHRAESVQYHKPSPAVCRRLDFAAERRACSTTPSRSSDKEALLEFAKEHMKYPYPTHAEKMNLAKSSGLNVDQVSHWFVNFRMRHWTKMRGQHFKLKRKTKGEGNEAAAGDAATAAVGSAPPVHTAIAGAADVMSDHEQQVKANDVFALKVMPHLEFDSENEPLEQLQKRQKMTEAEHSEQMEYAQQLHFPSDHVIAKLNAAAWEASTTPMATSFVLAEASSSSAVPVQVDTAAVATTTAPIAAATPPQKKKSTKKRSRNPYR